MGGLCVLGNGVDSSMIGSSLQVSVITLSKDYIVLLLHCKNMMVILTQNVVTSVAFVVTPSC